MPVEQCIYTFTHPVNIFSNSRDGLSASCQCRTDYKYQYSYNYVFHGVFSIKETKKVNLRYQIFWILALNPIDYLLVLIQDYLVRHIGGQLSF